MPELLARILFLFLLFSLLKSWWDQSGGKDNPLLDRLRVLLLISLLILAFFAPDTPVGAAIFGLIAFFFKPLGFSITLLVIASALITNGGIRNPAPRMILAALLVLILSSMPVVAYWFAEQAERDAAAAVPDSLLRRNRSGDRPAGQGNHSASHPQPSSDSTDRYRQSLALCCRFVQKTTRTDGHRYRWPKTRVGGLCW